MPKNLGMMLNDTLGDCTCAAFYHAIQVWTFNATKGKSIETEPDSDVEKLYELACGYKPAQGGEGPGGNEQHVLKYLLTKGAPMGPNGQTTHKIDAFVEVDPRTPTMSSARSTIAASPISASTFRSTSFRRPARRRRYGTSRTRTRRSSAATLSCSPATRRPARASSLGDNITR